MLINKNILSAIIVGIFSFLYLGFSLNDILNVVVVVILIHCTFDSKIANDQQQLMVHKSTFTVVEPEPVQTENRFVLSADYNEFVEGYNIKDDLCEWPFTDACLI